MHGVLALKKAFLHYCCSKEKYTDLFWPISTIFRVVVSVRLLAFDTLGSRPTAWKWMVLFRDRTEIDQCIIVHYMKLVTMLVDCDSAPC